MKVILKFLFICYWALTLLYVCPDNFVKAKTYDALRVFSLFCEQKWGFFAPPPKSNNRLYYTFFDDQQNVMATYEAIEPLLKEKQRKKPWNTREEAIDYIVNGSVVNLSDFIITQRDIYKQLYPDSTAAVIEEKAKAAISERYNQIPAFMTLVEYGKIVANKNLSVGDYNRIKLFKIYITDIQLPKFKDRASLVNGEDITEGLLLESPMILLDKDAKILTLDNSNNQ